MPTDYGGFGRRICLEVIHDDHFHRQSGWIGPDWPDHLVVLGRSFMNALPSTKPSWLGRLGVALATVVTLVVGFITASLLFVLLLTAGLAFAGWLWWQFRRLAREAQASTLHDLEGEYTVESVYTVEPVQPVLEDQNVSNREPHSDAPRPSQTL